jgi:hypothetical protein
MSVKSDWVYPYRNIDCPSEIKFGLMHKRYGYSVEGQWLILFLLKHCLEKKDELIVHATADDFIEFVGVKIIGSFPGVGKSKFTDGLAELEKWPFIWNLPPFICNGGRISLPWFTVIYRHAEKVEMHLNPGLMPAVAGFLWKDMANKTPEEARYLKKYASAGLYEFISKKFESEPNKMQAEFTMPYTQLLQILFNNDSEVQNYRASSRLEKVLLCPASDELLEVVGWKIDYEIKYRGRTPIEATLRVDRTKN